MENKTDVSLDGGARKKRVLFICTHNASRSQMAEGWLRALKGDCYDVYSAGTEPTGVHPCAIATMAEVGIDMRSHHSKGIEAVREVSFNEVVTVCDHARESCPVFFGGGIKGHQGFPDLSATLRTDAEALAVFRQVRDEIRQWIEETY